MRTKQLDIWTELVENCQRHCSVRLVSVGFAMKSARRIQRALRSAPVGTSITGPLWSRVANCYQGIPTGTVVMGEKRDDGKVHLQTLRTTGAFGNREWMIHTPEGWRVKGPSTHPSGATHDLKKLTYERKR